MGISYTIFYIKLHRLPERINRMEMIIIILELFIQFQDNENSSDDYTKDEKERSSGRNSNSTHRLN